MKRPGMIPRFSLADLDLFLDEFILRSVRLPKTARRRPFLPDPDDDVLVELALSGRVSYIVSSNVRHLAPARSLGIRALTPGRFIARFTLSP